MEKIYSSPIADEIPQLRTMLEDAGIACTLRNEMSAAQLPVTESTPELWIEDDDRLAEALQIKADFQSAAPVAGKDWVCRQCGEISEPQFNSCWKCGALRAGPVPVKWIEHEQPAPAPAPVEEEKEIVEEVENGTPCVACEKLIEVGVKLCPFCGWTQP